MPFVQHVGLQVVESSAGSSLLTLFIQPQHHNSHGVVHGGALFTLADTGMGAAVYSVLAGGESCTTVEIKINYFRPVIQGTIECRSQVIHRGRSLAAIESSLSVDGKLVAKASGTFAIRGAGGKVPGARP
jgi:acyl-CoA thioesterase